jgi:hypothetical protein
MVQASPPSLSGVRLRALRALEGHVRMARMDPNAFCQVVLQDEVTGEPIRQAPMHRAWHSLISEYDRLVIWSHVESGKSQQVAVSRVLWELGCDPTLRIAIVSNTSGQASKIVRTLARYIERSERLRWVFPGLEPSTPWTNTQLAVKRLFVAKDPSIQACGVHGSILGSRLDRIILDDVLDYENCRTPKARQDLWDWYHATLAGRMTKRGRVSVIGTAFHPEDLLHRFARQPGWKAVRYPVVDDQSGESRWPSRWPRERIERWREQNGPLEYARQLLCIARDDTEARFKREWIDRCTARGAGQTLSAYLPSVPFGCRVITGVDLAVQQKDSSDWTVLFTILVHANGDRQVLDVQRGRWSGPEIVQRIIDVHKRYQSLVIVENNAAQDFLVQFARGASAVPIRAFTTGRNKAHPEFGVESIAAEMASAKWIIPNSPPGTFTKDIQAWMTEMLYYDPSAHTGDCLMASWFAREGVRMGEIKAQTGHFDISAR